MSNPLWTSPVAATVLRDPELIQLPGRSFELRIKYTFGRATQVAVLRFTGVQAVKITYLFALTSQMVDLAYARVVDVGDSPWFSDISRLVEKSDPDPKPLRHAMILFDDGPCYEFICSGFGAEDHRTNANATDASERQ